MLTRLSRILMNEADASPGNGAPAAPAAPAAPTATTPAPAIDLDALVTRLSGVIDEKVKASQNATHAALRKAGVFKQEGPTGEPAPTPVAQPTPSAPIAAQAGLTPADVDARMEARLELERVIATREAKYGLTEAQAKRLRSSLSGISREALATEADSYLADLGLAKTPTPAPTAAPVSAPAATAAPAKPNISDRGAAAPTDTRDSEGVLNSRPLEITGHDVDALRIKHGDDKGLQMLQDRINSALRGVRIAPPGSGRPR